MSLFSLLSSFFIDSFSFIGGILMIFFVLFISFVISLFSSFGSSFCSSFCSFLGSSFVSSFISSFVFVFEFKDISAFKLLFTSVKFCFSSDLVIIEFSSLLEEFVMVSFWHILFSSMIEGIAFLFSSFLSSTFLSSSILLRFIFILFFIGYISSKLLFLFWSLYAYFYYILINIILNINII